MISCLESKEEKIIRKLSSELNSRGLEIDTNETEYVTDLVISPENYKKERFTVGLYEFTTVKNEDSLNHLITQTADRIQAWFELPDWNPQRDIFSPQLGLEFDDPESEVYKQRLTQNYFLTFRHTNVKTHKATPIGNRLLNHWEMTDKEFNDWSWEYLNQYYDLQSELVKTTLKDKELFQLKCYNEQDQHTLIFSENFKKEVSEKVGFPFYVILNMNFPIYISKKNDLEFLKENLSELESGIKKRDVFPTELITYTANGMAISEIE